MASKNTTVKQEFQFSWNVDAWNYYGDIGAKKWQYQQAQTWNINLGTLERATYRISLRGKRDNQNEDLDIRYSLHAGSPQVSSYLISGDNTIERGSNTFTWQHEITIENKEILKHWESIDNWSQANNAPFKAYFSSNTETASHSITAEVTVEYHYKPFSFNDGQAIFGIQQSPTSSLLTAKLLEDDPDGNGSFAFKWKTKSPGFGSVYSYTNWAAGETLNLNHRININQLYLDVSYTDGEGFQESRSYKVSDHLIKEEPNNSLQRRLAKPAYADGSSSPAGSNRKSAREISNLVAKQETQEHNSRKLTDMVWAWGQFIDHDIVDTPGGTEKFNIALSQDDPLLKQFPSATHFEFTRTKGINDQYGVRQQENVTTALIDASAVYGHTDEQANKLRSFSGGKLKTSRGDLLPVLNGQQGPEFQAGDHRATENPLLSSVHTLWMREHNRLADQIAKHHPNWNDELIYQKAKSQVTALIQHITYSEFLPALLGEGAISRYNGYNNDVDPGISTEFATAGYRVGHTLISDELVKIDGNGQELAAIQLKDSFFNVEHILKGGIDSILNGATHQVAQEVDTQLVDGLRNFLFGRGARVSKDGAIPAMDLAARNIQRGRDHGIADYNSLRAAVGLNKVSSFSEITSDAELVGKLQTAYGSVDDIDAFIGGLAEDHVNGGSVGELFSKIISDQFAAIRDGDQNWFEATSSGLSQSEISTIKSTSLADVIKRNSTIEDLEDNVFHASDDFVHGDSGDEVFSRGGGSDSLYGGGGNDKLVGSFGEDQLYGGEDNDELFGGADNDSLYGDNGHDWLNGGSGDDFLIGGDGNDVITGGAGSDTMSGGSGADRFVFSDLADSNGTSSHDLIFDFSAAEGDRLDLSGIDAWLSNGDQSFVFIGSSGFSGLRGEVRFDAGLLQANTGGDLSADLQVDLLGVNQLNKTQLIL
jgi:peroxidase